jgi:glyoxylase-like metal-dependent hydrolase (beta-lactamase superfamily II)
VALPDLPGLRSQVRDGRFRFGFYQYLGFVEGLKPPQFAVAQWLRPGAAIDLGGTSLTLLSTPGHTPDSVVLLDPGAKRLFAGDFIYPSSIFAFLPGANLTDYAASAARIAQLLDSGSVVYGAHGCDPPPLVQVPVLDRADVSALGKALQSAAGSALPQDLQFPRVFPVNARMKLLAKYPWMSR